MPTAIEVTGPHVIQWNSPGVAAATLGRGDNNDLFKIEVANKYADIQTNEYGEMAAQSVMVGATATVSFSLVSFDSVEAMKLQRFTGGNTTGTTLGSANFPVVGTLTNAGDTTAANDRTITLTVNPDINNRFGIAVARVRVLSVNFTDFGNKAARLVFSGDVLPDYDTSGGGTFYTLTTT